MTIYFLETISQSKQIYAFSVSFHVKREIWDNEERIFYLCDNHVWSKGNESVSPIQRMRERFFPPNRDS